MFCGSCGAAVTPGGKFCGKCGAAQSSAQNAAPVSDGPLEATIVRPAQPVAPVAPVPATPPPVAATPPAYTPPPVAPPAAQAPPAYTPPPVAPPAAYGAAPAQGVNIQFDVKAWSIFDFVALGAGLLFFIFSFLDGFIHVSTDRSCYDDYCYAGFSGTDGTSWHSWGWLGTLIVIAAIVVVLLKVVKGLLPKTPLVPMIAAGLAGLGWLLLMIRSWTYGGGGSYSVSPGWSSWVMMVLGLVIIGALATPIIQAGMANRPQAPQQFAQPGFAQPPAYQPQPPAYQPPPAQTPTDLPPPPA